MELPAVAVEKVASGKKKTPLTIRGQGLVGARRRLRTLIRLFRVKATWLTPRLRSR